jgi:uncharacterized membrane protein required for colicin V production
MPFHLQAIDVLLLVILALAALSGWRRGFAMVLLGYLGLLVGLGLGAWAATQAGLLVSEDSSVRRLLTAVVVFFLVAAACHAVGNLLGIRVRSLLGGRWTSQADAVGGAVVATVVAAVAMWFIALTLSNVPLSPFSRAVHSSSVLRTIDTYAPRPPAALAQLRGLLDRSGFPEAFATLRPPVVSGPPPAAARNQAVRRAGSCSAAASRSTPTWSSPTPTWSPGRAATRSSPTRGCGPRPASSTSTRPTTWPCCRSPT